MPRPTFSLTRMDLALTRCVGLARQEWIAFVKPLA
jgi:hypothetical protein